MVVEVIERPLADSGRKRGPHLSKLTALIESCVPEAQKQQRFVNIKAVLGRGTYTHRMMCDAPSDGCRRCRIKGQRPQLEHRDVQRPLAPPRW